MTSVTEQSANALHDALRRARSVREVRQAVKRARLDGGGVLDLAMVIARWQERSLIHGGLMPFDKNLVVAVDALRGELDMPVGAPRFTVGAKSGFNIYDEQPGPDGHTSRQVGCMFSARLGVHVVNALNNVIQPGTVEAGLLDRLLAAVEPYARTMGHSLSCRTDRGARACECGYANMYWMFRAALAQLLQLYPGYRVLSFDPQWTVDNEVLWGSC